RPQPTSSDVRGLQHNSVDESKEGVEVTIRARLGSDIAAQRMFLFYRAGGQEDYVSVPMTVGKSGEWTAVIPAEAVHGKSVQYYIEARDKRGRPVVASGTAASPYIISVQQEESPLNPPSDGGGETPIPRP